MHRRDWDNLHEYTESFSSDFEKKQIQKANPIVRKFARFLYKILRIFYVSWNFYFMPYSAIFLPYLVATSKIAN